MAPTRLTSWVFLVASAGDLFPPAPLTRLPAPACMSPDLRAFTALCGRVDSRDRPAAAAGGDDVGEDGRRSAWKSQRSDWVEGEVETLGLGRGNGFILTPVLLSILFNSEIRNVVEYPRSCCFQAGLARDMKGLVCSPPVRPDHLSSFSSLLYLCFHLPVWESQSFCPCFIWQV